VCSESHLLRATDVECSTPMNLRASRLCNATGPIRAAYGTVTLSTVDKSPLLIERDLKCRRRLQLPKTYEPFAR
jgi:hypothetical protein